MAHIIKAASGTLGINYLAVWFISIAAIHLHQNAKNLAQKFVPRITGNAMTCAFQ
jgi:hypothetical protein